MLTRRTAAALLLTVVAALLTVATESPSSGAGTATERAATPGCAVLRTRLARAREQTQSVQRRLRAARADRDRPRVRRLESRLRTAKARRAELRVKVRRACDRTPPDVRFVGGPADGASVQGQVASFRVASRARDVARYTCTVDRSYLARGFTCGGRDGRVSFTGYDGRPHHVRIWAVDRSGNRSPTAVARTVSLRFYVRVVAGGDRTCGRVVGPGGRWRCWGKPFPGGVQPPAGLTHLALGTGDHACGARDSTREVVCWGADDAGQSSPPPGTKIGDGELTSWTVTVGRDHSCAGPVCWGDDSDGELDVPPGGEVSGVGDHFSCADNIRRCWGSDADGRSTIPTGVTSVGAVGPDRACGIAQDDYPVIDRVCWGAPFPTPDPAHEGPDDHGLVLGGDHGCFRDGDFGLTCWGSNTYGQTSVPAGRYDWPVAGSNHTCALVWGVNRVRCWGDDRWGQSSPLPA